MKKARKGDKGSSEAQGNAQGPTDRRAGGAMSPSMRQLILSYWEKDSERAWDPDAYTRRPNQFN